VDHILPQSVMRVLTNRELEAYRQPFMEKGSGKPILQYIKELPNGQGKSNVEKIIADYSKKLTKSKLPKLMLYSVPGFITTIATAMWAKENLPNLEIVDIGEELHLAQESYPQLIGETISVWLQGVEQMHA
jgi:haloalkane dehalogenase